MGWGKLGLNTDPTSSKRTPAGAPDLIDPLVNLVQRVFTRLRNRIEAREVKLRHPAVLLPLETAYDDVANILNTRELLSFSAINFSVELLSHSLSSTDLSSKARKEVYVIRPT